MTLINWIKHKKWGCIMFSVDDHVSILPSIEIYNFKDYSRVLVFGFLIAHLTLEIYTKPNDND